MSAMRRVSRTHQRIAVAAGAFLAAIALSKCEPDTTLIRYRPDSGSTAGETIQETTSQSVQVISVYEEKPCTVINNMNLTKVEPQELSAGISISLNDIILEDGEPVASLFVFAKGKNPQKKKNQSGVSTINWSSVAKLKITEGGFKEFHLGLKGEILFSLKANAISVDGQSAILDVSVCGIQEDGS